MKISIYSREAVEQLLQTAFPSNTAVVSFYDPPSPKLLEDDGPVDYTGKCDHVFYIGAYDIDKDSLADFHLTYDTYFPEVTDLAKFIYDVKDNGLDLICQCEYGESRSAACAAAVMEHFWKNGILVFADYRYCPNQMIFHKVYDALAAEGRMRNTRKPIKGL